MKQYSRVLTIAGSDSGGGAGIQADIKSIAACGGFAMTAITAITVQNTLGVSSIHNIPADTVSAQIEAVIGDIGVDAIKIGMLSSAEIVTAVADSIRKFVIPAIILDPVMVATSGDTLLHSGAAQTLIRELFPLSTLVTPNIPEAEAISGIKITSPESVRQAAAAICGMGAKAVLIKGGHGSDATIVDTLFDGEKVYEFCSQRIDTPNTHGTGCSLSSAIATYVARGYTLPDAVEAGILYVNQAIAAGSAYQIGHGHGPIHHSFRAW